MISCAICDKEIWGECLNLVFEGHEQTLVRGQAMPEKKGQVALYYHTGHFPKNLMSFLSDKRKEGAGSGNARFE